MDTLFRDFASAVAAGSGYRLAATLTPPTDGNLREIWLATDDSSARAEIERRLRRALDVEHQRVRLPKQEIGGWADVYVGFWRTAGEMIAVEDKADDGSWTKVYEAWKEMTSALHRGYTSHGFEAWTIPCLYVAGRHLRIFAMRADEERAAWLASVEQEQKKQEEQEQEQKREWERERERKQEQEQEPEPEPEQKWEPEPEPEPEQKREQEQEQEREQDLEMGQNQDQDKGLELDQDQEQPEQMQQEQMPPEQMQPEQMQPEPMQQKAQKSAQWKQLHQREDQNQLSLQDDFDPETEQHQQLRDCEQQLKRLFTLCLSDRSPLEESRKWGIYYIINLLFKTYFRLNSAALSRTILKALSAYKGDMPPLHSFPLSQRVTFKYYEGVIFFLEENYFEAEKHLTEAWQLCHRAAMGNKERILTYLIPCHLLTTHTLPSAALLEPFPRLRQLFLPLAQSIKRGNLADFDAALHRAEEDLVRSRIYLTLERGRDIAMRNLLRRVFMAGGYDEVRKPGEVPVRRTRVPVAEFVAAVNLVSGLEQTIESDEVECFVANMIYKNLMKGYIARDRGIVVLSKKGDAFPGTGV